jgi:hypothetical protein
MTLAGQDNSSRFVLHLSHSITLAIDFRQAGQLAGKDHPHDPLHAHGLRCGVFDPEQPRVAEHPPGAVHLLSRNDLPTVICRDMQVYEKTGCCLFPGIG